MRQRYWRILCFCKVCRGPPLNSSRATLAPQGPRINHILPGFPWKLILHEFPTFWRILVNYGLFALIMAFPASPECSFCYVSNDFCMFSEGRPDAPAACIICSIHFAPALPWPTHMIIKYWSWSSNFPIWSSKNSIWWSNIEYDAQIWSSNAKYDDHMPKYDHQMKKYDDQMQKYDDQMRKYDDQILMNLGIWWSNGRNMMITFDTGGLSI